MMGGTTVQSSLSLHHPWVRGETASTEKMEDSDKKLSQFQDLKHKLEASVFALLVNQGHQDMTMSEARIAKSSDASRHGGGTPIMRVEVLEPTGDDREISAGSINDVDNEDVPMRGVPTTDTPGASSSTSPAPAKPFQRQAPLKP